MVDWCAPPSGARVIAGRGAGDDEPGTGVGAVEERVQAAQHERVVDGADRQQRLAGQVPGQAELAQQQEQVHLRDAQLDVLPGGALRPAQHPVLGPGALLGGGEDAGLVDEPGEVGGGGHVRRGGHQVGGHLRVAGQVDQHPAEDLLGGDRLVGAYAGGLRDGDRQRPLARRRGTAPPGGRRPGCRPGDAGSRRSHSVSAVRPCAARSASTCSVLSSAEWLRGLPAIGSPQPLTVYAKTTLGRSVTASHWAYASSIAAQVVPAQVGDERAQLGVGDVGDERRRPRPGRRRGTARAAPRRPARTATGTARWASRRSSRAAPRRPAGRTPRRAGGRT